MGRREEKNEMSAEEMKPCTDEWHLGWAGLVDKYGREEAEKRFKPTRSCLQCGDRRDYGD